jgi:DNA-binding response OmpR family regulator
MLQPGTGIGLSIVKELLELHGGSVSLDASYTQGARFIVTFKLGNAHFTPEQLTPAQSSSNILHQNHDPATLVADTSQSQNKDATLESLTEHTLPQVLIVDDNPEIRSFIRESIGSNYQIFEAADGKEALQMIDSNMPDFIVSDVMMAGMDGIELTQKLKQNQATAHIPLLLLTARSTKRETVEGLQAGADDYLSKPFDSAELAARIDAHLKQKRHIAQAIYAEYRNQTTEAVISQFESTETRFERQFIELINQNLSNPDIGVDWLTEQLHVERSTLFRRVQKIFSCTPNQYIRQRRLEVACQLLIERKGTVSEVAYAVGFQSLSYFSRCFNQTYKQSPTEYLKSA